MNEHDRDASPLGAICEPDAVDDDELKTIRVAGLPAVLQRADRRAGCNQQTVASTGRLLDQRASRDDMHHLVLKHRTG